MADAKKLRGARSVLAEGQPAFIDEHPRHGKYYNDGRKVIDLDRVGAAAPDSDADVERALHR
jgi:hypothetical protein